MNLKFKKIDHDEDDRDSSEYEEMDDDGEEAEIDMEQHEMIYEKDIEPVEQFQQEYISDQEPTSSNHEEIPVSMKIDYEGSLFIELLEKLKKIKF